MNDDEKGKRFLELIDEQNNLQWSLVAKLSSLIASKWNSEELQKELETLVEKHSKITKELNSLDDNDSML
ncbi:MAG: hypothetical protein HOM02_08015 [Thaumarchaeota archaeon]|jgi:hypothetical protein|nr:hypothetical protein [Nitrososphaerota archaeon]MBT5843177.1 hypothetical protein [Nitrososphaerota archaeon]